MRRAIMTCAVLVLAACHQPVGVSTSVRAKAGVVPPVPAGSLAASSLAPAASPAAPVYLKQPANTTALTGTVRIDAAYIIANHAASLISNNGSALLAAGNGIVSEHGGGLISEHGAGVVATATGNIVANNGGALTGKTKYALAQADAPAYGTQLPAAAMRVQVFDMDKGQVLPLGIDDRGQPVDAIYTNLGGAFAVYLPAGTTTNVRVAVDVPGATDPRLSYHLIAKPGATDRAVDEDSATVTRYLRQVFRDKFANLMKSYGQVGAGQMTDQQLLDSLFTANKMAPEFQALLRTFMADLFSEIHANPQITATEYQALGLQLGDELLAEAGDLDVIQMYPNFYAGPEQQAQIDADPLHPKGVMEAFKGVIADLRQGITRRGAGKGPDEVAALFAAKPYLAAANQYHARLHPQDPAPFYAIRKPSDFTDFIATEYFTLVDGQPYGCVAGDCPPPDDACQPKDMCFPAGGMAVLNNLNARKLLENAFTEAGAPITHLDVLEGATNSLVGTIVARCFDPAVNARMHCLIRSYKRPEAVCDAP